MKKLLANILFSKNGKGVIGLISDKAGKISFRRSASIVVLTSVVAPYITENSLDWKIVVVICACLIAPAIPSMKFNKKPEKPE